MWCLFCCKLKNKNDSSAPEEIGSKEWERMGATLSSHGMNCGSLENYQIYFAIRFSQEKSVDIINY